MIHAPGIYFGLPEAEYHADPSLSTSGIKKLIQDPEEYWDTAAWNPNAAAREHKDHLARGTLWHCRILEPENFDKKYVLAPYITDHFADGKEILRTKDDMKEWLEKNNVAYKKSLDKPGLERAVWEAHKLGLGEPEPYLFDRENKGFEEFHAGKTIIWSEQVYDEMLMAEAAVKSHPYFSKAFQGGMSEVSIFWVDESGIPMKARIDKLKPNAILDYKTIYVGRGKPLRQAALTAIKYEHYDIQAAVYTIGVAHVVNALKSGDAVVWGDVPGQFIDDLKKSVEKPFGFVFQKEERPYTVRGLKVIRRGGDTFNAFGAGLFYMQQGLELYTKYKELYGENRWFDPEGMIEVADHEIYYT